MKHLKYDLFELCVAVIAKPKETSNTNNSPPPKPYNNASRVFFFKHFNSSCLFSSLVSPTFENIIHRYL